jgi:hypothetical protein
LYRRETLSLTLKEEGHMMVSENSLLRGISELNMDKVTKGWKNKCIVRSSIISTFHHTLFG